MVYFSFSREEHQYGCSLACVNYCGQYQIRMKDCDLWGDTPEHKTGIQKSWGLPWLASCEPQVWSFAISGLFSHKMELIIHPPLPIPGNKDRIIRVKVLHKLIRCEEGGRLSLSLSSPEHSPFSFPQTASLLLPFSQTKCLLPFPLPPPSSRRSKSPFLCLLWGSLSLLEFFFLMNLNKKT